MSRSRALSALAALAAGSVPAVAAASTSHAVLWHNRAYTVMCGIETHLGPNPTHVLCQSSGIPAPRHTSSKQGNPGYVQLASRGSSQTLRLKVDSFEGDSAVTLGRRATWSSLGVTCTTGTGNTVRCVNRSGHGFVIGNRKFKSF